MRKRKLKIVVLDKDTRIKLPALTLMTIYRIMRIVLVFLKRHMDEEKAKYLELIEKLNKQDIKLLEQSLPQETFDLVNISSGDGSKVIIKVI